MSISDADYQTWLAADGKRRVVLVEAQCYSSGAVTRYFANSPYVTGPSESPASTAYDDLLISAPSFRVAVNESLAVGDLEISNAGGALDSWLDDAWDGWPIHLYYGDPSWARADFRPILAGIIDDISAPSRDRLSFRIRDKKEKLNGPVQSTFWTSGPSVNLPVPLIFGYVTNITPRLGSQPDLRYRVNEYDASATFNISDVRDKGVSVSFVNESAGAFHLTAAPAGAITCDVARVGTTYKPGEILQSLLLRTLSTADLDLDSFAAFDALPGMGALGLYIADRRNFIDVIDEIMRTTQGFWYFDRLGKIKLGRVDPPTGSAVAEFGTDDVIEDGISVLRREPAVYRQRLGVIKNWTVQSPDDLAGSIADRERWHQEFATVVSMEINGLRDMHKGALDTDLEPTLYQVAPTNDEQIRRKNKHGLVRTVYRIEMLAAGLQLDLGDEIRLTHPRYGFATGANAIVVGIDEDYSAGRSILEIWK